MVEAGAHSYDEAGLADGDFQTYRQCSPCHDLVARLYVNGDLDHDDSWLLSDLADIARDAGEPWPPETVQP